jgi:hypothetical protein
LELVTKPAYKAQYGVEGTAEGTKGFQEVDKPYQKNKLTQHIKQQ